MQMRWLDAEHGHIAVTLDDDERLGTFIGPVTMTVPVANGNTEYQAILAGPGLGAVEPYLPPPAPRQLDTEARIEALEQTIKQLLADKRSKS